MLWIIPFFSSLRYQQCQVLHVKENGTRPIQESLNDLVVLFCRGGPCSTQLITLIFFFLKTHNGTKNLK